MFQPVIPTTPFPIQSVYLFIKGLVYSVVKVYMVLCKFCLLQSTGGHYNYIFFLIFFPGVNNCPLIHLITYVPILNFFFSNASSDLSVYEHDFLES